MGDEDQVPYEDDDLDPLDDFDDDADPDDVVDDSLESGEKVDPRVQARIHARHEIERRNELKALKLELDEWDDFLDEDDL
jgi:hypothetical protein